MYRYELLVIVEFVRLLVENEDMVVVDKFFFIFVYFCGRFRYNTVIFILGKEY